MFFHCKRLRPGFRLPTRGFDPRLEKIADPNAVGYDIYAPEDGILMPLSQKLVPLGFAASFTPGYIGLLLDRSGMALKGVHRSGGVIDPSYRNEWCAVLYNSNKDDAVRWNVGDRIVQVVFFKIEEPEPVEVDDLDEAYRKGGFGSTGA